MSRSRGKWDLVFETDDRVMGFQLAEPAARFELEPARLDEQARNSDVPRIIDNLDAGMGFSRRVERVPNGYAYTMPGFCRSPGGIFHPPGKLTEITLPAAGWVPGYITQAIRFNNTIFLTTRGRSILALSGDGATATVAATFASQMGPSGSAAVFNNRLYVMTEGGLYYSDAGGGWSGPHPPLRGVPAVVNWRPLGVPTDVMVATSTEFGGNAVRWVPIDRDPTVDANWSAPLRVGGDLQYGIHRLVAAPRRVFILRPDGIYDIDELGTRAFNIAPWIGSLPDANNGIFGMTVGNGVYYTHSQGLAFVPTTGEAQYRPEWATPGWGLPYEGPVRGAGYYGCLHDGWGLFGQWDPIADQSFVSAGRRDESAYGQASHVWHGAEAVVPGRTTLLQSMTLAWAGGNPQLLICSTGTGGVRAFWQSLPRFGSPLQDLLYGGGFVPADLASLFLPADPWDRPSSVKTLLQMDMVTERLDPTSDTLKGLARADEETAWADYGTAETGNYTGLAPLETTEGRFIQARVDAIGSPVLRSLELRSAIGVELREARRYTVILAWDNALKGARGRETADPERRLDDLRSLLGRVCTLDDGSADGTRRVRVLQVQAGERKPMGSAARAGAAGTVGAWAITAQVMVSVLDRPFRWDGRADVDRLDADRVWL